VERRLQLWERRSVGEGEATMFIARITAIAKISSGIESISLSSGFASDTRSLGAAVRVVIEAGTQSQWGLA
jgi:hypothetical protein